MAEDVTPAPNPDSPVVSQVIINLRADGGWQASWNNVPTVTAMITLLNNTLNAYVEESHKKGQLKL